MESDSSTPSQPPKSDSSEGTSSQSEASQFASNMAQRLKQRPCASKQDSPSPMSSLGSSISSSQEHRNKSKKKATKTLNKPKPFPLINMQERIVPTNLHPFGTQINSEPFYVLKTYPGSYMSKCYLMTSNGNIFSIPNNYTSVEENQIYQFPCVYHNCPAKVTITTENNQLKYFESEHSCKKASSISSWGMFSITSYCVEVKVPNMMYLDPSDNNWKNLDESLSAQNPFIKLLLLEQSDAEIKLKTPGGHIYISSKLIYSKLEHTKNKNLLESHLSDFITYGKGFLCQNANPVSSKLTGMECQNYIILETIPSINELRELSDPDVNVKIFLHHNLTLEEKFLPGHSHSTEPTFSLTDYVNFSPYEPIRKPQGIPFKLGTEFGSNINLNIVVDTKNRTYNKLDTCKEGTMKEFDIYSKYFCTNKTCKGFAVLISKNNQLRFHLLMPHTVPNCHSPNVKVWLPIAEGEIKMLSNSHAKNNTSGFISHNQERVVNIFFNNHMYTKKGLGPGWLCSSAACEDVIRIFKTGNSEESRAFSQKHYWDPNQNKFLVYGHTRGCTTNMKPNQNVVETVDLALQYQRLVSVGVKEYLSKPRKIVSSKITNSMATVEKVILPNPKELLEEMKKNQEKTKPWSLDLIPSKTLLPNKIWNLSHSASNALLICPSPIVQSVSASQRPPETLKDAIHIIFNYYDDKMELVPCKEILFWALNEFKNECVSYYQEQKHLKLKEIKKCKIPGYENSIGWDLVHDTLVVWKNRCRVAKCTEIYCLNVAKTNNGKCDKHDNSSKHFVLVQHLKHTEEIEQKNQKKETVVVCLTTNLCVETTDSEILIRKILHHQSKRDMLKNIPTKYYKNSIYGIYEKLDLNFARAEYTAIQIFYLLSNAVSPNTRPRLLKNYFGSSSLFSPYIVQYCKERGLNWAFYTEKQFMENYKELLGPTTTKTQTKNYWDNTMAIRKTDKHIQLPPELEGLRERYCWGNISNCTHPDTLIQPNLYCLPGVTKKYNYYGLNLEKIGNVVSGCHESLQSELTSYETHCREYQLDRELAVGRKKSILHLPTEEIKDAEGIPMLAAILNKITIPNSTAETLININVPLPEHMNMKHIELLESYVARTCDLLFAIKYDPDAEQLKLPIIERLASVSFVRVEEDAGPESPNSSVQNNFNSTIDLSGTQSSREEDLAHAVKSNVKRKSLNPVVNSDVRTKDTKNPVPAKKEQPELTPKQKRPPEKAMYKSEPQAKKPKWQCGQSGEVSSSTEEKDIQYLGSYRTVTKSEKKIATSAKGPSSSQVPSTSKPRIAPRVLSKSFGKDTGQGKSDSMKSGSTGGSTEKSTGFFRAANDEEDFK